jgi:hypothetical protein
MRSAQGDGLSLLAEKKKDIKKGNDKRGNFRAFLLRDTHGNQNHVLKPGRFAGS